MDLGFCCVVVQQVRRYCSLKPGPPKRPPYPSKYSLLLRLPSYFLWSATKNSDYIQVNNVIFFKVVDTK